MSDERQPEVFQFKGMRSQVIYWMVVAFPSVIFVLVGAISSGAFVIWFLFFLGFILLWVIYPYLLIRGGSDVEISNKFIRRRFYGIITQSLSWDNIKEIRVLDSPTKDHPNRAVINFLPEIAPSWSFTRTGRIVFMTLPLRKKSLSNLLNLVNKQIAYHGIKVAWWDGDVKTYTNKVEWPLPGSKWGQRKRRR